MTRRFGSFTNYDDGTSVIINLNNVTHVEPIGEDCIIMMFVNGSDIRIKSTLTRFLDYARMHEM